MSAPQIALVRPCPAPVPLRPAPLLDALNALILALYPG